jgi:hypothetical protein
MLLTCPEYRNGEGWENSIYFTHTLSIVHLLPPSY